MKLIEKGPAFLVFESNPDQPRSVTVAAIANGRDEKFRKVRLSTHSWFVYYRNGNYCDFTTDKHRLVHSDDLAQVQSEMRTALAARKESGERRTRLNKLVGEIRRTIDPMACAADDGDDVRFEAARVAAIEVLTKIAPTSTTSNPTDPRS